MKLYLLLLALCPFDVAKHGHVHELQGTLLTFFFFIGYVILNVKWTLKKD